jgi:signal peptidase I
MEPTLRNNNIVLVKKSGTFTRKSIVVFYSPIEKEKLLIKRIIGLPGDSVQIFNTGKILVNNKLFSTGFEKLKHGEEWIEYEWNLKGNNFILIGDNRSKSQDSRFFGPVFIDKIIGKTLIKIKPLSRIV